MTSRRSWMTSRHYLQTDQNHALVSPRLLKFIPSIRLGNHPIIKRQKRNPSQTTMRMTTIACVHWLIVFAAMVSMPGVAWGQFTIHQLEGYWLTLTSEGYPGTMELEERVIRFEDGHDFFMPTLNVPWEKLTAYTCFYQLEMKEINDLLIINASGPHPISRRNAGTYYLDTARVAGLGGHLRAKYDQWNLIARPDDIKHLELSLRARVDVYACKIWVVYLEDHGYGDCDGNLRMIPQYGLIKHPDNRKEYVCSVVLPVFMKLPKVYWPHEH